MSRKKVGETKTSALQAISRAADGMDGKLRQALSAYSVGPVREMYGMLEYFLGFKNERLKSVKVGAGKRFRPGLTLYLAGSYGAQKPALSAALSIELFHNFTLIHDDIVDRDEMRRGRPTVWKLWGNDHAINSGDGLSLLASEMALGAEKDCPGAGNVLFRAYTGVTEGQYLDFKLANQSIATISKKVYIQMIARKTGVLVGVSAEIAGIAGRQSLRERKILKHFGESLGIAYQIADDYRSVWATQVETGKDAYGDIRERKRALPAVLACSQLSDADHSRFMALYDLPRPLTDQELAEARALIVKANIQKKLQVILAKYVKDATASIHALSVSAKVKDMLVRVISELTHVS